MAKKTRSLVDIFRPTRFLSDKWEDARKQISTILRDLERILEIVTRETEIPTYYDSSFYIDSSGWTGFGTDSPSASLDAQGSTETSFWATTFNNSQSSQYAMRRARGTSASPAAILTNDALGSFSFRGHTGSGFTGSKAQIAIAAEQGWTTTANGTRMTFSTTANGSTTLSTRMTIKNDGSIGIGTASPSSLLHVSGGDVRVTGGSFIDDGVTIVAPDYVFDIDYDLRSIEELDQFIFKHNHLPNVPSAEDIKRDGLNVSQFQMKLLEKIEELTLYTIDLNKRVRELEAARSEEKE